MCKAIPIFLEIIFSLVKTSKKHFTGRNTVDYLLLMETKLAKMILAHLSSLSLTVDPFLIHNKSISGTAQNMIIILFAFGFEIKQISLNSL